MRNNNFFMKNILVTIVTLLCLVVGTVTVVQQSCKIVKVGANLMVLNDNASFYNESSRKTDEMTEEYLRNQAEREKFYQSEDTVTRVFSNLPTFTKLLVWILALAAIPFVPIIVFFHILRKIYVMRRRMQRAKRKARNQPQRHQNTYCRSV